MINIELETKIKMNKEDKIYKKIQNASLNGEKDFLAMDKLWNRVEEKLDNQVVVQKKNTWQKIAVAASVALVGALLYIFALKEENVSKPTISTPDKTNESIVSKDSVQNIIDEAKENVVFENTKKAKFNATIISSPNVNLEASASSNEEAIEVPKMNFQSTKDDNLNLKNNIYNYSNMASTNNNYVMKGKVFDAIGVNNTRNFNYEFKEADKKTELVTPPLLVVDGKAVKNNFSNDDLEAASDQVKENEEVETVVVLKEPLYIINGVEYSEESLFGKNPTSPYAPLDKQKIKSVEVLQAPEALSRYGEKGKKGIVIITTKNGKPVKK